MNITTIKKHLKYHTAFVLIFLSMVASLYAQQMNFDFKNATLKEVLKKVTEQTGYDFVYSDALKEINNKVTVFSKDEKPEQFFARFFPTIGISYKIRGKQVALSTGTVSTPATSRLETNPGQEELTTIKGTVIDDTGAPLPGVLVSVKGARNSVITDILGKYTINVPKASTLVFKFLGMKEYEAAAENIKGISVVLEMDTQKLEDIVVTGYQMLSKERATGSFSVITQKNLENKLQPSIKTILEGQSSGVVLTKQGDIEIRGVSTILGVKTPLIVVDGYPLIGSGVGIESINPENIDQITVLKDAVAASIYGARASNGVIVITTKNAEKGFISLSYKGTYGITLKPDLNKLNISSVQDYMDAELDLFNQDSNESFTDYNSYYQISDYAYLLMAKEKGLITASDADAKIALLKNNNALSQIEKYLLKPKQSYQHNLDLSGGTDKNLLRSSVRFVEEGGNLDNNKKTRLIFDINNIWSPKEWISIRVLSNVNYTRDHATKDNIDTYTTLGPYSRIQPYTRLYDNSGNLTMYSPVPQRRLEKYLSYPGLLPVTYHPSTDSPLMYSNEQNLQLRLGGDVTIKFFDWLTGKVGGSWTKGFNNKQSIQDANSLTMRLNYNDGTSATNSTKHYIPEGGSIDETNSSSEAWVIRSQLNANKTLNGDMHRLNAMIGNEISKDTYYYTYQPTRLGYNPVSASYNSGFDPYEYNKNTGNIKGDMLFGKGPMNLSSIGYGYNYAVRDNRFVSWYANGSYEYNNRYLLSASARLDLANFFGTDPKFRYKPTWSVGGTYKISEEPFFTPLKNIFDRFYLRGSYGVNGNISLNYAPYLILGVGTHNTTTGGISYSISSYPNNSLRWERTQIVNLGIDMSILKNRLNIAAEYYNKYSSDLIANEVIDETRGTSSIPQNVGSVRNEGFELTLNGDIVRNADFTWRAYMIASYNRSKVTYYNVKRSYFTSYASPVGLLVQGYPMDGFWGGKFAGLDNTGTAQFYNVNGDKVAGGSLTAKDAVYFGTMRPKVDMSLTNTFRYKNFEASFMFIAKLGHKFRKDNFSGSNYTNRHVGERWRVAGDEAKTIYPKLTSWNMDLFYFPYSDVFVANASYVKLRDLSISYYLPKNMTGKFGLSNIKLYFQTRNLFYIAAKGVDIDPETAEINSTGSTGAMTNQAYTSLQLRPELYFGISINL